MLTKTNIEDFNFTYFRSIPMDVNEEVPYDEYVCLSGPFQGFRPIILSYYPSIDEVKIRAYKEDYFFTGKVFIAAELSMILDYLRVEPIKTPIIKVQGYE